MNQKLLLWALGLGIAIMAITGVLVLEEKKEQRDVIMIPTIDSEGKMGKGRTLLMQVVGVPLRSFTRDEAKAGIIMKADEQNLLRCPEEPARQVDVLGETKPPTSKRFWAYEYTEEEVQRGRDKIYPIFNGKFFISEGELAENPNYGDINTLTKISSGKRYYFMSEIDLHFSCTTGLQTVFACGNGVVEGEQIVDGEVVHAAEECDDGNPVSDDGCSAQCLNEICTPPPDGLVSWWPGDGNANDVRDGNNGTLKSGAEASAIGKVGIGFRFPGTLGNRVEIANSANVNFSDGDFSIDAWVKTTNTFQQEIVSKVDASTVGYIMGMDRAGQLFCNMKDAAGFATIVRAVSDSPLAIRDGLFHHVACVRSGNTLTAYVDGAVSATATHTVGSTDNTELLYIGVRGGTDLPWVGEIDEVDIFSRALTADEIGSIYAAGSYGKCMPVCGNGIIEAGEECDDEGESATCNADCTNVSCGDGIVNAAAGEDCEEGAVDTATCNADCTNVSCGDGIVNAAAGETCDNGPLNNDSVADACRTTCVPASCGDGVTDTAAGETCDDSGESATCDDDCTAASCGDGNVNETSGEMCDDENPNDGDGCSATCTIEVSTPPQACTPPPSGLVSWWPGDGNANDVQDENDGTLKSGAEAGAVGKVGIGFRFPGTLGNRVEIANSANVNFSDGDFSIDAWVKTTNTFQQEIVSKVDASTVGYIMGMDGAGQLFCNMKDADGATTVVRAVPDSPLAIRDGLFHHVACVRSGNTLTAYVDGAVSATATHTVGSTDNTEPLYIGVRGGTSLPWVGEIDEVDIFSRALDPNEIQDIYNAGSYGKCTS